MKLCLAKCHACCMPCLQVTFLLPSTRHAPDPCYSVPIGQQPYTPSASHSLPHTFCTVLSSPPTGEPCLPTAPA
jgi:hypothetical protein